ncbi:MULTISPECIES: GtrA family protein [unclassified Duganella]|uniref:GtrA family protein n=1 Tax=unclassified Duganella TaxID=2636909 RepID=UPI001E3160BB|nr:MULTISPECIES: GtrA family protein [unclassified Duganella]
MIDLLRPPRQFVLYLIGGVLSAALDVGLMQLLIIGGMAQLLAVSLGFIAGFLFNYSFHARLTFRHASRTAFVRYILLVGANYLLTMAIVALALGLGGSALAGKLVALPLVAANGYLLGKHWVFAKDASA